VACGQQLSCTARCSTGCDLLAQNCPSSGDNCTVSDPWVVDCLPFVNGSLGYYCSETGECRPKPTAVQPRGGPCSLPRGGTVISVCTPGTVCLDLANNQYAPALAAHPTCRAICRSDAACNAGEKCMLISPASGDGVCVESCTLFGSDCPAGQTCNIEVLDADGASGFAACGIAGSIPVGGICDYSTKAACAPGSYCNQTDNWQHYYCLPLCDDDHPCNGSLRCAVMPGLPKHGGLCQ
jgi:hypothetical protein